MLFSRVVMLAFTVGIACTGYAQRTVATSVAERFRDQHADEIPDFQRHVMPLIGRLGCNGRACHGSFQGRGGFRLSLFGYDFQADFDAMLDGRVDTDSAVSSLLLTKPTDADAHEGGLRFDKGSWQYHLLHRWIQSGASFAAQPPQPIQRLEVQPSELAAVGYGEPVQLKAIAHWADGTSEDVTPLCRFQSKNDAIARVDASGLVTALKPGDSHVVVFYDAAVQPVPIIGPVSNLYGAKFPSVPTPTPIDRLVVDKLRKLGVVPSPVCSDHAFLRRVRLDMTGTLPSESEVREFISDRRPGKRDRKIDELLESPGYAAWWSTKLCDFTGNDLHQLLSASPFGIRAGQDCYDWVYRRVDENVPYDELVAGIATAAAVRPGRSYTEYCQQMSRLYGDPERSYAELDEMSYYWARRDFREVETRAIAFAYAFMGMRIQCAQCHKHPFDRWSKDDFHQFKNFFARVGSSYRGPPEAYGTYKKMLAELGVPRGKTLGFIRQQLPTLLQQGKTVPFPATFISKEIQRTRNAPEDYPEFDNAKLLGGEVVDIMQVEDPRVMLMQWLRRADNPFFAKALVNRVWAAYFNVGIVDPPDDLSLANPPSNKPLLDYLASEFIKNRFDMKWLHRTIARSRTYQLAWKPNETNRTDRSNFSHAVPRRLPAEVLYDAIQFATASDQRVAEMHQSNQGRAIALATGPDSGNLNRGPHFAMRIFGRSTRASNCDCDRSMETSLLQSVYTQNDFNIWMAIDAREGWLSQSVGEISRAARSIDQVIERTYLRILSRYPTEAELTLSSDFIRSAPDIRSGLRDVMWALLNTKEFIVNH